MWGERIVQNCILLAKAYRTKELSKHLPEEGGGGILFLEHTKSECTQYMLNKHSVKTA